MEGYEYEVMMVLFFLALAFIFYVYLGYPLILYFLTKDKAIVYPSTEYHGDISIVMVVCNEEDNIKRKIENLISLKYGNGLINIIIVDDASTDSTASIAEKFDVTLIRQDVRSGKAAGLNTAMKAVNTELVLMVDCRQELSINALLNLSSWFVDDEIGAVSGELLFKDADTGINKIDGYWKYEKFIRKCEAKLSSVPGVTGAIYMLRTSTYQAIPENTLLDDVQIPMQTVEQGYRVIFDDRVEAWDVPSTDIKNEKRRKIRTLSGNYQLLFRFPKWILPFCHPIWWQFLSHKIFRLLAPVVAIISVFLASAIYASGYQVGLIYICFVAFTLLTVPLTKYVLFLERIPIIRLTSSFVTLNWFCLLALYQYFFKRQSSSWKANG